MSFHSPLARFGPIYEIWVKYIWVYLGLMSKTEITVPLFYLKLSSFMLSYVIIGIYICTFSTKISIICCVESMQVFSYD